jgi:uncharacterized cupin superfamily protein
MNILNLIKAESLKRCDKQPNYRGAVMDLSEVFEAKKLGFHLEIIDPKNFSCPYHWHEGEEELIYVLEGEAIVRRNNEFRKVGPGDLIFYETGAQSAHNMYNHTDKPFKFLALSNAGIPDKCFYPDSKKESGEKGFTQNGEVVNYFKDEEDPAKYWPRSALNGEV